MCFLTTWLHDSKCNPTGKEKYLNEMTLKGCHGDPCNICTCTTRYYNHIIVVINECGKYNNNI